MINTYNLIINILNMVHKNSLFIISICIINYITSNIKSYNDIQEDPITCKSMETCLEKHTKISKFEKFLFIKLNTEINIEYFEYLFSEFMLTNNENIQSFKINNSELVFVIRKNCSITMDIIFSNFGKFITNAYFK